MIIKTKRQLLDCFDYVEKNRDQPPWEDWHCVTDETGIHAKPFDNSEMLMSKAERQEMAGFEREIELNLPCTAMALYEWAVLNDLDDWLTEEFLQKNPLPITESQTRKKRSEADFTKWLDEIWCAHGQPEGSDLFDLLKNYVCTTKGMENSPIRQHWTTSAKGPGLRYCTGASSKEITKKTIVNKVGLFKKDQS